MLSPPPASAEALADRSLEDAWTFVEKSDSACSKTDTTNSTTGTPRTITTARNQRQIQTTSYGGQSQGPAGGDGEGGDGAEDYADLVPFVKVLRRARHPRDAAEYDAYIDVPLPRCHSEVVRTNAAKSAAGRRRAALQSSEEATRPFSRLNRAKTAALLVARDAKSRREVAKARSASMSERGITGDLIQEIRHLHVLEQAENPCLQSVPLLSRSASSAGAAQGQDRRQMEYIAKAFEFVEDGDHRVAAVNLQGQGLDDAWTALLGSTLEASHTVRTVMLNRNSIGDRGVALLAQSLRINTSVETLSLGGNRLTDKATKSLASLLRSGHSSLKVLNLAGIAPRPTSIARSGSSATEPLPDPCISAMGAAALALALGDPASGKGCTLLSLNLAFQRVEDAGAIALAAALKSPSCHLEVLGLSKTQLTDAAALAFARALIDGRPRAKRGHEGDGIGGQESESNARCPLRRLDLSRNNIKNEGACGLAAGIIEDFQRYGDGSNNENGISDSDDATTNAERLMDRTGDRNNNFPDSSLKGRGARAAATATATAAAARTENVESTCASGRLLGLDLAFNSVGAEGTAALKDALIVATGMVFLELRGNAADDPVLGGRGHSSQLLEEVERACTERRQNQKISGQLAHREVLLSQESSGPVKPREKRMVGAAWGSEGGVGLAGDRGGQPCKSVATIPRDHGPCEPPCGSLTAEDGADKYRRGAGAGKTVASEPVSRRRRWASKAKTGVFRSCDAVKRRPLEGRLPMRGYYVSPLLDSCFDLLMLREPVVDPADNASYVNQTRVKLEQRRVLRERQEGGDDGGGDADGGGTGGGSRGADVSRGSLRGAGEGRGQPLMPFPKGSVVSPLAIHAKREQVLVERRRLFSLDSDFASRKNARIAGRGSSRVPRSKLLTQRHSNAGFTKELMRRRMPGIGVKCPRGLRAHFMGLQNFEYDWGAGGK